MGCGGTFMPSAKRVTRSRGFSASSQLDFFRLMISVCKAHCCARSAPAVWMFQAGQNVASPSQESNKGGIKRQIARHTGLRRMCEQASHPGTACSNHSPSHWCTTTDNPPFQKTKGDAVELTSKSWPYGHKLRMLTFSNGTFLAVTRQRTNSPDQMI